MNTFIFYLFIGVLGAFIDYFLFFLFQDFGLRVLTAQWVAALIGNTHNHLWHYYRVFTHNQSFKKAYILTLIFSIILITLSGPLLLLINRFIHDLIIAKLILFPFIGAIGYYLRKSYIYKIK